MKRARLALLGLSLFGLLGTSKVWNASFEAEPAGTDLASDLDTFINVFKEEVRQRAAVELVWGNGTNDNGLARVGSARCFIQNGAPTDMVGVGAFNSSADAYVSTLLTTTEPGGTDDVGRGRCWIDLDGPDNTVGTPDDRSFATWDETNNIWKYTGLANSDATTLLQQRFLFDPGKYNLLYNGSFEVYDGVGGGTGSTAVPPGWTLSNATVSYTANPTNTEGNGVQVNVTATAGNGAITQTLTTLKASTTYYVVGRVKADAGDSCDLATTGATTNLNTTDVTSTTFVTTSGTFVTDNTVTAVVLQARSINNTDVCHWDSIAVYETSSDRRGLTQAGAMASYDSDTGTGAVQAARTTVPNLRADFTPPGPGWVVEIHADLSFHDTAGSPNSSVICGLDNGSDMAGTNHAVGMAIGGDGAWASMHLSAIQVNPTPGTNIVYTAECLTTDTATVTYNGAATGPTTLASNLWIVAHPTR